MKKVVYSIRKVRNSNEKLYMVQKGFKVLAVGNDETFFDGNIEKETEVEPDKIILRAYTTGKPTIVNGRVEIDGKFYTFNN